MQGHHPVPLNPFQPPGPGFRPFPQRPPPQWQPGPRPPAPAPPPRRPRMPGPRTASNVMATGPGGAEADGAKTEEDTEDLCVVCLDKPRSVFCCILLDASRSHRAALWTGDCSQLDKSGSFVQSSCTVTCISDRG